MSRWLVALIVAILIPCYGFAAVGKSVALVVDESGHALAHYADQAHHHDDEGGMRADDSDESAVHLHGDDWVTTPVLVVQALSLQFPSPADGAPLRVSRQAAPPPFIEGPIRPPRFDSRSC
ncbi:hypothetical protein LRS03_08965 [Rhizobacter sp. J219]|uniref:hypothetical protein n=1 Tax=Rhizobacter sp. J219 TaxID=2898430 RepID=UPI0021510416|nr:hypothetical protein [Rhizobacter sp. J219]MCR5882979.1 hypothetical protein [Rhizobacter sp. J219]